MNWKRAARRAALVIAMVLAFAPAAAVAATAVTDAPASFKKFGSEDLEANSEKISR